MLKRILSILLIVLSPAISLIVFTPLSMWPAIIISFWLTRKECSNVMGESLCGMGTGILIGFIINSIIGFILITYLHPSFFQNWKKNKEVLPIVGLLLYFICVTFVFILFSMVEMGMI